MSNIAQFWLKSPVWVSAVALVVSLPAAAMRAERPAPRQDPPPNELCLSCHGDPAATAGEGRRIGLDPARFDTSSHGAMGFTCVTCHTDLAAGDIPHAPKLARVECAACHPDAAEQYGRSIHAAARRQSASSPAATCADCHSTHEIGPASDPRSRTYALNLPETCGACHGDGDVIARGHIRAGNVLRQYEDSIHGRAISRSGLVVSANCATCHGSHDIRLRTDPESLVFRTNIPATCGKCHEGIQTLYADSVHGAALARGDERPPVCADCHTAHGIQRADVANWQLDVIRECGTCHTDKMRTYRDTFHGQVTALGFVRVATCSACHDPHRTLGAGDPRSKVSSDRRLATCQQCHPNATAGFARYDPHADRNDPERNPGLYWAARGMHWLLLFTFSLFGLHSVLWFGRGTIERRRRRRAAAAADEEAPRHD